MRAIRTRLESLERNGRPSGNDDIRATVEALQATYDESEFQALVDDIRQQACREDTDPTLPCQVELLTPDGINSEECEQRLATWLAKSK